MLHIVALCRRASVGDWHFLSPLPATHKRVILALFVDVVAMFQQGVMNGLLGVRGLGAELWEAIDDILDEMEAVHLIQYDHIERRGRGAFLLVAPNVQVFMVG